MLLSETRQTSLIIRMPFFSLRELSKTYKTSSGSATGSDGITYPIISHLGLAGELAFLELVHESWQASTLPQNWEKANIILNPQPKEPGRYCTISLLGCLAKTAKRMVLNWLRWKLGPRNEHLHGFMRGMRKSHSIATFVRTICTALSVVVFLDLEVF